MGDPTGMIFGGLTSAMEDTDEVFGRTAMKEGREDLWDDANEHRVALGLEPLDEPEYPGSPSWGGTVAKTLGGIVGMSPPTPTPFSTAYRPDDIRSFLIEKGHYTEEEADNYVNEMTYAQLLRLGARHPQAYVAKLRDLTPEQEAEAKRAYLGQPAPEEFVDIGAGEWGGRLSDIPEGGISMPHKPPGLHNAPPGTAVLGPDGKVVFKNPREDELVDYNYLDTYADPDPVTGEYPIWNGTEQQTLSVQKQDPGRLIVAPKKSELREGQLLHPTVQKTVEQKVFDLMRLRDQLTSLEANFDPNWLSLGGRIQGKMLELGSVLGALDGQQRFELFARSAGIAQIAQVTNDMIRLMTGAQMSKNEADRLMIQEINVGDAPDVFIAKLQRSSYFNSLALARNRLVLEGGVLDAEALTRDASWSDHVSIETSRQKLWARAEEMYQKMGVDTGEVLDHWEAKERMRVEFKEEWGMDPMTLRDEWIVNTLGEETIGQMQSLDAKGPGTAPPAPAEVQ